jgi:hypothetical protein
MGMTDVSWVWEDVNASSVRPRFLDTSF